MFFKDGHKLCILLCAEPVENDPPVQEECMFFEMSPRAIE